MKDYYESLDLMLHIGWVEVTGEEGQNGYLWYLKAEGDTRARFTDYLRWLCLSLRRQLLLLLLVYGSIA